ncbi:MAG: flippase-like domain-containing protein [Candidatus Dormibacteraeota bacterium]|nr:flippase-like domain-containing protein [Candidatus Dormibacteraeota bacterium]
MDPDNPESLSSPLIKGPEPVNLSPQPSYLARARLLARSAWSSRWVRAGLNTGIGALMLLLLLRSVPAGALAGHLEPRHFEPVVGVLVLTLLSQLVRAGRWMLLLRGVTRVGYREALWVNASTQLLNYAIPVRAGEALRLWWLARRRRVPMAGALGIVVIDHSFDLCGVAVVLSVGAVLSGLGVDRMLPSLPGMLVALSLALAMFSAIVLSVVLGPRIAGALWVRRMLRPCWHERLSGHATAVRGAAASLGGRRRMAVLAGASAVAVMLDGLAFAMLFMALGLAVPLLSAVVTQVTLLYATLLPSAPGYVGSLEAGGTLLLSSALGLPEATAAGAMVLWHLLAAFMVVALGLVALHRLRAAGVLRFRVPTIKK